MKRFLSVLLCVLPLFVLTSCDVSEIDAAIQTGHEQVVEDAQHRFSFSYDKGSFLIVVDAETGVNYLIYAAGYKGGITPLLDSSGNVVVTPSE